MLFALSFGPSAHADSVPESGITNPVETFLDWFLPKLHAVLEESSDPMVDQIPKKLIVAQAGLESGWGRSYTAKKRKNLFGLMRKKDGVAMSFDSTEDSIRRYLKTLTEHRSYARFRQALGIKPAHELSHELKAYSTNPKYAQKLNEIMRSEPVSRLDALDEASPSDEEPDTVRVLGDSDPPKWWEDRPDAASHSSPGLTVPL